MNSPSEIEQLDEFDIEQVELTVWPREIETITLNLPKTMLESLRKVVVKHSMLSMEALIRLYIGRGSRQDLSQLFSEQMMDATAKVLARR